MKMSKKEKDSFNKDTEKISVPLVFKWNGASLNYERMMSMAYTYSMLPWLERKL